MRITEDIGLSPDGDVTLGHLAGYIRDRRIPLEVCPSSNVQTGEAPSIARHPLRLLRQLQFRVTVNTDNRLMSQVPRTCANRGTRRDRRRTVIRRRSLLTCLA